MTKKSKTFSKRKWLNKSESPSTGAVVGFYGNNPYKGEKGPYMFLEVADCHQSIRLHKMALESEKHFIDKIKSLNAFISDYIKFLEHL